MQPSPGVSPFHSRSRQDELFSPSLTWTLPSPLAPAFSAVAALSWKGARDGHPRPYSSPSSTIRRAPTPTNPAAHAAATVRLALSDAASSPHRPAPSPSSGSSQLTTRQARAVRSLESIKSPGLASQLTNEFAAGCDVYASALVGALRGLVSAWLPRSQPRTSSPRLATAVTDPAQLSLEQAPTKLA